MPLFKLAVIGECMAELTGQPLSTMQQNFGGDTMNTAIYLRQLTQENCQISFITAMGKDPLSNAMIAKWQEREIDTQYVLKDEHRHVGLYHISNDTNGERYFQYWRNDSAARYLMSHSNIADIFAQLATYNAVFLSGISIAILPESDQIKLLDALDVLKQNGVKIIFDSNYRPALWQGIERTRMIYQRLYELSALLLVTFDDEQQVWNDQSIEDCAKRLCDYGAEQVVIKDGEKGCYCYVGDITTHVPTKITDQVVDTTAAGDSFNAGYLSGWVLGKEVETSANYGNQLAAQVIQKHGAIVDISTDFYQ